MTQWPCLSPSTYGPSSTLPDADRWTQWPCILPSTYGPSHTLPDAERSTQWPCFSPDAETSPTLYVDGFPTEKAEVETPQFRVAESWVDPEYPALLAPGRVLQQLEREFEVVKGKQNKIVREDLVELNSGDAAAWDIQDGDEVEVLTSGRRIAGRAVTMDSLPPGMIAVTSLFGQMVLELQASEEAIPAARLPGLRISPARIVKR